MKRSVSRSFFDGWIGAAFCMSSQINVYNIQRKAALKCCKNIYLTKGERLK